MDSYAIAAAMLFIASTLYVLFGPGLRWQRAGKLPPGPKPLPIIGNILQMGNHPHQTFTKLSKTYGPLMSIHLGSLHTVIVSSPEMAKQVFQKFGQAFSSRNISQAVCAHDHDSISMTFMPIANPKWRDMRRICKEQMFVNHSMDGSQRLREEKLQQLLDYVGKCTEAGRPVDIREAAFITILNLMSATLCSFQATEFESEATEEFRDIIEGVAIIIAEPNFADYFPILKPFDPQGVKRKSDYYFGALLGKIDSYIVERLEWRRTNPDAPRKDDLLETLLEISRGKEFQLNKEDIKHLFLDLFVGGTGTSTTSIEWIMSELLLHPDKLVKLKEELKSAVGEKNQVKESDIPRLPYLQAVIKEVMRLHPPGPLLFPRAAATDQEVNGYLIPKGTQVLVNAWAMGRDPGIWSNPESFEPERFLGKSTDFKGQDFELVPFGAGRRICPGVPLAVRILPMTIAALVHDFDWKLEAGSEVDDEGLFGFSVRRAVPLRAIPSKC